MPIQRLSIDAFIAQANQVPVFDVRSPGEFNHAHVPGAYSLPLFTDEERKVVGTAYKQQGKQKAIKIGLDYFGVKMNQMIEEVERVIKERHKLLGKQRSDEPEKKILVHCWRGGMRSAGVAWLLDLYGFNVYTLEGGYKTYRNWVLQQFDKEYDISILGGYTGSAKTDVLLQLESHEHGIINLEGLANHKGSAFGALGQPPQPTQEMFENILATELYQKATKHFWLEDESQRIGSLNIPHALWKTMRQKQVYFLDIPFENRLDYILSTYTGFEKEKYINAIIRIQKRLGPLETKTAINCLLEDDFRACFRILLAHYDKAYHKSLLQRDNINSLLKKITCDGTDSIPNCKKLLSCAIPQSSC